MFSFVSWPFWWPTIITFSLADGGEAADERLVVAEAAVAAHLHEVGRDELEIVERVGPRRVAHDLHPLPGAEVRVDLPARLGQLGLQRLDLRHGVGGVLAARAP